MKTKTLQLLNLTPEQYEDKTLHTWVHWCTKKVRDPKNLQKLLVNQPLFNWWKRELDKLELEFLKDMEDLIGIDASTAMQAYDFTIRKIYKRFSKPLIKNAHHSHSIENNNDKFNIN